MQIQRHYPVRAGSAVTSEVEGEGGQPFLRRGRSRFAHGPTTMRIKQSDNILFFFNDSARLQLHVRNLSAVGQEVRQM